MKWEPKNFLRKLRENYSKKENWEKMPPAEFAIIDFQAKMVFTNKNNKPPLHSMSRRNDLGLGPKATQESRARSRTALWVSRNLTLQSQLA